MIVCKFEDGHVLREVALRDAAEAAQVVSQARPDAFHRVGVDLAEVVTVFVASVLALAVADGLVLEALLGHVIVSV